MTKLWGLRWWMMGLLMLGSVINYLTRATLAVAAPTVLKDLDITTQQYSWILSAFQLAIMLQPLCGYVLDVLGLKRGFAIFAVAWSFISMAHGLAHSWKALFVLRGLLGLAEGSANPAGMKAVSEWFPARERGLAGGVFNIGCGHAIDLNQVIALIGDIVAAGTDLRIQAKYEPERSGDIKHSWADIGAARKQFGYRGAVSFAEGLRRTIAWYNSQG